MVQGDATLAQIMAREPRTARNIDLGSGIFGFGAACLRGDGNGFSVTV